MDIYEVTITETALEDMEKIYEYIANELLSPENAIGQYNRIAEAILTLESFPERFAIFGKVITPCPICGNLPKITMTSKGERTIVSCPCKHVLKMGIYF